jgi:hypothetical protein
MDRAQRDRHNLVAKRSDNSVSSYALIHDRAVVAAKNCRGRDRMMIKPGQMLARHGMP